LGEYFDRWRRDFIYRSYMSRRRERKCSHKRVSKEKCHKEEKSHMELVMKYLHKHPWFIVETNINIHKSKKGKSQFFAGQRKESHNFFQVRERKVVVVLGNMLVQGRT
jgi:hypothetical protein